MFILLGWNNCAVFLLIFQKLRIYNIVGCFGCVQKHTPQYRGMLDRSGGRHCLNLMMGKFLWAVAWSRPLEKIACRSDATLLRLTALNDHGREYEFFHEIHSTLIEHFIICLMILKRQKKCNLSDITDRWRWEFSWWWEIKLISLPLTENQ